MTSARKKCSYPTNSLSAIIMASYFASLQTIMGYLSKNMSVSGYATQTVCENVRRVIKERR